MAKIFDDIRLGWEGRKYVVPARQVMEAIAAIEAHITLQELTGYGQRGVAPMGRLANAYAAVLRLAGAPVTDAEVYLGMFKHGADHTTISNTVNGLLFMMIPPEIRRSVESGEPLPKPVLAKGEKEPTAGNSHAPAKGRSKRTLGRRSGKAGAHQASSGV